MNEIIVRDVDIDENSENFSGEVEAENFRFNYFDNGPIILNDINLSIKSKEKIGVVGRTGAGKSSLISAIFRMRNGIGGTLKGVQNDLV